MGAGYHQSGLTFRPTCLHFAIILLLWNRIAAQIRYSIQEELKIGTVVGNIAKDLGIDRGALAERNLRIVTGSKQDLFQVNQRDGALFVNQRIDREELCGKSSPCHVNIKAVIENPLEMQHVTVEILDVNDHSPSFTSKETRLKISESAIPGARFQLEGARDPDPLDRETAPSHSLLLTALDGGTPHRSDTLNITIIVLDVNDNAPVCNEQKYTVILKENAPIGTFVVRVNASDLDDGANGDVTYAFGDKFRSHSSELFDLDTKSGEIKVKGLVDFEDEQMYEINIQASDKGPVALSTHCNVFVKVEDVNDNKPEIDVTSLSSRIREDAPLGTVVALMGVTDLDSGVNGQVVCTLAENLPFELKASSEGNFYSLVTKSPLDRESVSAYDIRIIAKDLGTPTLSSVKTIRVDISDINDNCPVFSQNPYTFYLVENNPPGASMFAVSASDADEGENALVSYSLEHVSTGHSVTSFLNINSENGIISALKSFDFETLKTFQFQVVAKDSGTPSISSNATVKVFILDQNDNAPVILSPLSSNGSAEGVEEIPRNANAGHSVTKVRAYDADIGYNAWLSFSLQHATDASLFGLERYTGQIRTLRSFTETDEAQHKLVIVVKDNGNFSLSATSTVIINAVEPKEAFAASETKGAVQTEEENNVTFYLIITLGSVSALFLLSIIGLIVMQCSKPEYPSKYSRDPNYADTSGNGTLCHSIQYRSGDKRYMLVGPRMSIGSAIVSGSNANTLVVPDHRRRISGEISAQIRYSIQEELKIGTVVGNIAKDLGIDRGALAERNLRIVMGSKQDLFQVNQRDGALFVNQRIDREELCGKSSPCHVNLKAVIENPLEMQHVTVEILDVNDHSPSFPDQAYRLEVPEFTVTGARFQIEGAHDPDTGLNAETGEIKVKGPIDFEQKESYEIDVYVSDKGALPLSTHCNVFVKVEDVNDNKPEIDFTSLSRRIPENAFPGTVVALMGVTDLDSGVNGQVVCTLTEDLPFELKASSEGNFYSLVTKSPLDRESVPQYDISITAKDLGTPSLSSVKTIRVEVSDINDNNPIFSQNPYTFYLVENNAPGSSMFAVSASDADEGENALVSYSLEHVSTGHSVTSFLNINSENGNVYALKSFDFETLKTFQFQVVAKDSGTPSLSSNVTVKVYILDQNDNAPMILSPLSSNGSAEGMEEIPRNVNPGHSVTKVRAYDADIGYNAWLSFSLLHATDASLFGLERYTGQIRMLRSFTETDEAQHKLVIVVKDNGNVSLSATATVIINAVEPKEAFAASDTKGAVQTEEENNVTFYLIITLGSVSALFLLSIIGLIVMQCSKPEYPSKYSRDSNYADMSGNGTLCHSIQYRSGDKRYMLVGPRMSIGSAIVSGSNANTLVVPDHRKRISGEISAQIRYSIQEELKIGTVVGNIAKDLGIDRGALAERNLRIVTGSKQDLFQVNQRDGALFVNQRIDREELCGKSSPCHVNLKAVIENPLEMQHVTVEILDVNDHSPSFPSKETRLEISESAIPGARFQLEGARDPDVGINALRFYKLSQNENFRLETEDMNENSKIPFLILQKPLDRETAPSHSLQLIALDGGTPHRSDTLNITINVLDVNDNAPVCNKQKYTVILKENAPIGTFVIRVNASDLDDGANGEVMYAFGNKFSSQADELFDLDTTTGAIKVKGLVDFEDEQMYEINIKASDKGSAPLSTHCNVFVKVEDVNDNKPEIDITSLSSRIREDAPPGTLVALMGVTDLDSGVNGQVVCTLPEDLPFDLKASSEGNFYSLVTKSPLDRESVPQYDISITAKDLGTPSLSSVKKIRVEVSDINDNCPVFSQNPYTFYLVENNVPGASIFAVSASDADEGENALVSYSLEHVSTVHSVTSFLNINSENGNIYALKSFDFETLKTFQFQVVAKDSGTPSLHSNVTVKVFILDQNDNAPVILSPLSSNGSAEGVEEIPRNANAGHSVTKVRAYDADIGYNAWLSFSLQHATDASLFGLERYTGQIRTLRLFSETDDAQHKLVILVKDNGNVSLSATTTVIINAVEPKEAFAASDTKGTVQTEEENNVTFYLIITLGSVSALFLLSVIGLIVMQCSKPDHPSKYSRDPSYADTSGNGTLCHSIQYRSGDKRYMLVGPRMSIGSAIVPGSNANTLVVPDHRKRISGEIRYSIQEELKIGTVVGNIAKDMGIDRGNLAERNLRIVTGSKQDLFQVNQRDGALFVNRRIDIEELCGKSSPCHVNLKAVIENPLEMQHVTVEILDVNDHSPSFADEAYRLEVPESTMTGTQFQIEGAHDPDSGGNDSDEGPNGQVEYSFRSKSRSKTSELFELNRETGEIKVKGPIDFEQKESYEIDVYVSDKGALPLATHCNVFVKVEDVNDNKPEIDVTSLSSRIREDVPPGTLVALMGVTDLDSGVNGQVVCSLPEDLPFELKASSEGNFYSLVTKSPLDRESMPQYDISITAKDLGTPSLSSVKTVRVEVSDINDNNPVFSQNPYTFYLVENNAPGASIFAVSASDADEGENALVSYSLEHVSTGHSVTSFLNINSANGIIYALKSFDFETLKTFQFQVVAKDSGTPSLSSNVTVNVFILDQNDNAPVILSPLSSNGSAETVDIPRNVNAGHSVTKLQAYDADIGYNAWLSFSLQHATDASLFGLERYTGQIRTLRSFSETDEAQHKLVIVVKDNGNISLSATATVIINAVEPKEAFAASDTKSAVQTEEENNVTFYLIITLGSVSALFLLSIIGLIVMQCSKPDYSNKYSRDPNYADTSGNGTLCHSIQYRSGDKRYMLVGPRMSIVMRIHLLSQITGEEYLERAKPKSGQRGRARELYTRSESRRITAISAQIRYSIQEELKIGTVVANIAKDLGIDRGALAERNLRIVSGSKQDLFQVNQRDGALFVNQRIDREELCGKSSPCHVNLKAVIENPLEMQHVTVEILDVNDHSPSFPDPEYRLEISESAMTGVRFQLEGANDPDIGINSLRLYKLSQNDKFELELEDLSKDAKTPFLLLRNPLDRERNPRYNLTLTAVDGGTPPRSGSLNITVIVLDVNDNVPVEDVNDNKPEIDITSLTSRIREDAPLGTVVALIGVSDLDSARLMLMREKTLWFHIHSSTSNVTVKVFILDQNDNAPVILSPLSSNGSAEGVEEIPRNVNAGHSVTKVRAYDADIGYNAWLSFSLQHATDASLFGLERYTGQIRTLRSFSETDEAQHKLVILVKDNGNISLSATATVFINAVEPKEAFAASDTKGAVQTEEENNVTFYLIITLGSVSALFLLSIIGLIVMQCSKPDYPSKYSRDANYADTSGNGTLCHSIQYRSGDKRYMLVGPRMSIGSTIVPGSNANTLVVSDHRRRISGESQTCVRTERGDARIHAGGRAGE
ncbi:hypothetical protein JZ751_005348 [Albula glossodonta]|uniref:Cadherin domain-containing protein n=1 Tax=Albula glossodonta TaxID=121402 RepID=A0A8T2N5X9_9TELE|nr:hypothetical protein JZ751_005348 [Albula glossodonta]